MISPNMGLNIPLVSTTPGPQYAQEVNASLSKIDIHNHTSGQGSQIPSAGININAALSMNNQRLTNAAAIQLASQGVVPASGSIYRNNDDLYYVDGTGANVRITQGGAVAVSGAVGFSGLPFGTAGAFYDNLTQTFVFQSATNTAANIDGGSILVREVASGANAVTIASPLALAADYTITLPGALPTTTNFLMMGPTGQVTNNVTPDNTTIQIVGNQLGVASGIGAPTGTVSMYAGSAAPTGWLLCDGSVLDSVANPIYASLFAVIGTSFGGTGANNFNVPDCRGIFVRGVGSQTISGQTYTGTLGTKQVDNFESHNHGGTTGSTIINYRVSNGVVGAIPATFSSNVNQSGNVVQTFYGSDHTHTISSQGSGTETYPANIALNYIIKI